MEYIFYFIGVLYIIHEASHLLHPIGVVRRSKYLEIMSKRNKSNSWSEYPETYKYLLTYYIPFNCLLILWIFVGLLTYNWVGFLILIFWTLSISLPVQYLTKYTLYYVIHRWVDSLIGFFFGIFILINKYHLRIDLYGVLIQWLN